MTIETKYNIGDEVWARFAGEAIQCKIDDALIIEHSAHGLRKIPDWILIKDLSRKVQDLERELKATRKELDESMVVNGEKLRKASIEIQREKMYGKLQAKMQKERRRATQLTKEVVELRLELNRLKEEGYNVQPHR